MDSDSDNESDLTTLHSGETPTLTPEPGTQRATLASLNEAVDDATYDALYATIPREHKVKIGSIWYIKYEFYRSGTDKRRSWYMMPAQCTELIQSTKETNKDGQQQRGRLIWKCAHCSNTQKMSANNDNKTAHLLKVHGISKTGRRVPRASPFLQSNQNTESTANNRVQEPGIRQAEAYVSFPTQVLINPFKDALIAFICICQISLGAMVSSLFVEFLRVIYPPITKLLPKATDTIRSWIMEAFNKRKERLKKDLQDAHSKIHFSFDLWTSPNHLALIGIVAHFIDKHGYHQNILIAIRQLNGSHSGENQAAVVLKVIKEYGLDNKIGYFVTDNATNNDTAIDIITSKLLPHLSDKQRRARRLRCLGHVINLAAKAFLYGEDFEDDDFLYASQSDLNKELRAWRTRGPVGKLHNIIVFICRSPQRLEKFSKIVKIDGSVLQDYDHLSLCADNATRWNSLYSMIERALKLRDRITTFCQDHENEMHGMLARRSRNASPEELERLLSHDILSGDDWKSLAEVLELLKPFYVYTKSAEGKSVNADRGVLSQYIVAMNELIGHIRHSRSEFQTRADILELNDESTTYLNKCLTNCWTKLDAYFALLDETPACYAAIATIPKSKFKYFERVWRDAHIWEHAIGGGGWVQGGRDALEELWQSEYATLPLLSTIPERQPANQMQHIDALDCTADDDEEDNDELHTWLSEPCKALPENKSLPHFWLEKLSNPSEYRLAQLALDMMSIPAMSSECERVFSQAKLLITGQRCRLKPDIIEATQCLRMWLIIDRQQAGLWKLKDGWTTPTEINNFYD